MSTNKNTAGQIKEEPDTTTGTTNAGTPAKQEQPAGTGAGGGQPARPANTPTSGAGTSQSGGAPPQD